MSTPKENLIEQGQNEPKRVPLNTPFEVNKKFNFVMDVMKASESEGRCYLEGKASDTGIDQQDERLSPNAISSLAAQVENATQQIPAYPTHKSDWTETLGYIVEATINEENELWVKIELDMTNDVAARLWKMINLGRKFGLSVGGYLRSAFFEYNGELKKIIKVLDDFIFDHVVVTTKPVNPRTWLKQIGKSLDDCAIPAEFLPEGEEHSMEELENNTPEVTAVQGSEEVLPAVNVEEAVSEPNIEAVLEEVNVAKSDVEAVLETEDVSKSFIDFEKQLVDAAFSGASDEQLLTIAKNFAEVVKRQDPDNLELVQSDRLSKLAVVQKLYAAMSALEGVVEALDPANEIAVDHAMQFMNTPSDIAVPEMEPSLPAASDVEEEEEGNDFAALLEHNLNNWLSNYGYRVIDVIPALEEGDEEEVGLSLGKETLPDDAFAHVETMEDGTKIRKLPYKRKNGKIDKRHLSMALATLNGAMGGVDLDPEARETAYKALASAWEGAFKKPAPALKGAVTKAELPTPEGTDPAAVTPPAAPTEMPPETPDQNNSTSNEELVTQMEHLSNIVQQMQEQMMQIQQSLASVGKSFDDISFAARPVEFDLDVVAKAVSEELDKRVTARMSSVIDNNNKTAEALDEKLGSMFETVHKSLDDIKSVKGEVESVAKAMEEFEQLKPVLKAMEHLPVRKAIVVDTRDDKKPQRPAEPPTFSSEAERQRWIHEKLRELPYKNPYDLK